MLVAASTATAGQTIGGQLPPWSTGTLDIHQIQTGRGNAAFFVLPDGTTLLVDAGDAPDRGTLETERTRPNATRSAAQWIAQYMAKFGPARASRLDVMVATHYHDDHIAAIPELAKLVPMVTLVDRGDQPPPPPYPSLQPYLRFRSGFGTGHRVFEPGQVNQFISANTNQIQIRNLAGNGRVWHAEVPLESLSENDLSLAFELLYGKFAYYTGGDLAGFSLDGKSPSHDIESAIASVAGPVDVAVLNHHGWLDTTNNVFLAKLQPRVVIVPAWHASHPDHGVIRRLLATKQPKPDLFLTSLLPAPDAILRYLGEIFQSTEGHVVIRVKPGGAEYQVIVLDDSTPEWPVKKISAPYRSGAR